MAIFGLLPIVSLAWISLFDWRILEGTRRFVGFEQYSRILSQASFWNALGNSLKFMLLSVPAGMVVGLLIAMPLAQKFRGSGIFRTLYYLPSVCSMVALSMMWTYIFLPKTGLINMTMSMFGWSSIDFLNDPKSALPSLAFMSIWIGLGPRMIIYISGLLAISPSVYEAAKLDGASETVQFWKISVPLLMPSHIFILITGTIGSLQLFTPVYMMTKGGPLGSTDLIGYHIYVEAWQKFHVSTSAAQSFVLFLVIAGISFIQWKSLAAQQSRVTTE